jgi:hypothetical protein
MRTTTSILEMADGRRSWTDGVLVSRDAPPIQLQVDARLAYLGPTELEIRGLAHAERHHWVETRDGEVRRLLVAQFEGFLPSNDERYRYRLPDPVEMGGLTWGRWTMAYAASRSDAPEVADTAALLERHGLQLADELVAARYATIVAADARHELLLFMHEPLRAVGHTLRSAAAADGDLRPGLESVAAELHARFRRIVRVEALASD